jgi:hypothetical protein
VLCIERLSSLARYCGTVFSVAARLARCDRTHLLRGSALGIVPAEHLFSLARRLCGTDQRAEALEIGFQVVDSPRPVPGCLGVPTGLGRGRKRELDEDVTFRSLPEAFVRAPFGSVMAQVQGAMCVMGVPGTPPPAY